MTLREMYNAFEYEMNTQDTPLVLETSKVLHWINKAIAEIIDFSYTGVYNAVSESEYNRGILKNLYVYKNITTSSPSTEFTNGTEFDISSEDIRYILRDAAVISFNTLEGLSIMKEADVTEATMDTYNVQVRDPFSMFRLRLNTAFPLRLYTDNKAVLISDGNYTIPSYNLSYIKNPTKFILSSISWDTEYEELPSKTHDKIVSIAVRKALENEGDQRYNTNINEDKQTKA
jgi:hypothetical protein